ncbi:Glu-tRNA(Gln) amidotransferase subunit GatE [Candidatus Woesearchaeota archaeon]|nr:Glu-tRNA(Gln) amidotransferase subunit GatE [Candidatus Woesearchaeota archaeon]
MQPLNYKDLGLRVGLEIHRQISSHKLFCSCPSELTDKPFDALLKRSLHAVKSETGQTDIVAEHEVKKGKHAVYEVVHGSCCQVETDEEPIHPLNMHALQAVLEVALLLKCKLVDAIQIMRKQVLDYSNTSGFQRTALVAMDGRIETQHGNVGITSICIEEDAARRIRNEPEFTVFRLDRLGIPLIEITTEPDMTNPDQVKEIAAYLGMVLKSTGKYKSGIGTIRQDLNVSIKGHPRVEIKGVQDLQLIPTVIEKEVLRQLDNVKLGKTKSEVRKMLPDGTTAYLRPMPGASRMYVETDHPIIALEQKFLDSLVLPELLSEKTEQFEKKYNLPPLLAREVITNPLFTKFAEQYKQLEASFIARVLSEIPKDIKTRLRIDTGKLTDKDFAKVLDAYTKEPLSKQAATDMLAALAQGHPFDLTKYQMVSDEELEKNIKEIVAKNKGASMGALMGIVMHAYKNKVDGKKVSELLKKYLQ